MTVTWRTAIGVVGGLALVLAGDLPGARAQSAPAIRVGFSSAMTGPSAITGEGVKWAAQMLADEFSGGGITEHHLEERVSIQYLAARIAATDAVGGVSD